MFNTRIEPSPKELIVNPSFRELRELARKDERTTEFGSPSYITRIRNRSAKFTEIIYDEPNETQRATIERVHEYLRGKSLIRLDRQMCKTQGFRLHCRFYVTVDYARIALMWGESLFDIEEPESKPDILVIDVPEWEERKVLVDARTLTTYVLGTDYMGEIKKANLRLAMWIAKNRGGLGLHAGSKLLRVKDTRGRLVEKGVLLFGLSGTGKTTLTCHHHWLNEPEGIVIRQDDVNLIQPDGYCVGTEQNYYIKTEGLEPKGQPLLYKAATSPTAYLENVFVDEQGRVDFFNSSLTSNGRALVRRSEVGYTDEEIDLPEANIIIFITRRNDVVPPIARLTPEQGAAFFMLGESIETSAGDPTQAGKSIRVVGTNPFIIGPFHEEGNWFYNYLKNNPKTRCYLLNSGSVGTEKITVIDSATIIREIARDSIEWKKDEVWGYEVGGYAPGIELSRFDFTKFYSDQKYKELVEKLRTERREWLKQFAGLDPAIVEAI